MKAQMATVDMAELAKLLGGNGGEQKTKEQALAEAKDSLRKAAEHAVTDNGCADKHSAMIEAAIGLARQTFNINMLPERINRVMLSSLAHAALARAESPSEFWTVMGDHIRIHEAHLVAAGVMLALGHRLDDPALEGPSDPDREARQARGGQQYL